MENSQQDIYPCPSFNSYSLAEIGDKLTAENSNDAVRNEEEEDFAFALVREDKEFLANEFFYDGKIRSVYPVFNRDLLLNDDGEFRASTGNKPSESSIAVSLSKHFIQNREVHYPSSCSPAGNDELENIPAGRYCFWWRKAAEQPSPSRCKKSKSTGPASKRWTFRRINNEEKGSFVVSTPRNREEKVSMEVLRKAKGKTVSGAPPVSPSSLYVQNRAIKEGDKKKSYLPYRQDLVGIFVNVNSLGKSLPRF